MAHPDGTVFTQGAFLLLVTFSLIVPALVYRALWTRRAISPGHLLAFGFTLVLLAGLDVYLLRQLTTLARLTLSTIDDAVFDSELTVALYLLPTLFAGTGLNVISHVIIRHLGEAERRFAQQSLPAADGL